MDAKVLDFLEARIAEDESLIDQVIKSGHALHWRELTSGTLDTAQDLVPTGDSALSRYLAHWDPQRMNSECAVKREVTQGLRSVLDDPEQLQRNAELYNQAMRLIQLCQRFALAYRNHPAFQCGLVPGVHSTPHKGCILR